MVASVQHRHSSFSELRNDQAMEYVPSGEQGQAASRLLWGGEEEAGLLPQVRELGGVVSEEGEVLQREVQILVLGKGVV